MMNNIDVEKYLSDKKLEITLSLEEKNSENSLKNVKKVNGKIFRKITQKPTKIVKKPWNCKYEEYIINNKKYYLPTEILCEKSDFFKKLSEKNFKNDKNVLIKDYNDILISHKYIDIFIANTIYDSYNDLTLFRDMINLYILSDFLDCKDQKEYYSQTIIFFFSKHCKFKGKYFTKDIDVGYVDSKYQGNDITNIVSYPKFFKKNYNISSNEYLVLKDFFSKYKDILLSFISIEEDLSDLKDKLDEEEFKTFEPIYYFKKFLNLGKDV